MINENKQYHQSIDEISNSGLKLINQAPAKYYYKYIQPIETDKEYDEVKSDALIIGSAFHTLVLEPHLFTDLFVVSPIFEGTGSRDRKKAFLENNKGKYPLSIKNYQMVEGMRDAIMNHPVCKDLLEQIHIIVEHVLTWTNKETGVACKIKPDAFNTKKRICIDLKSTDDASDNGFRKSARKFRYHVQAPFYLEGLHANGFNPDSFVFIAVEKEPPFLVNLFYADGETLANGREIYLQDLEKYRESKKTGVWDGYGNEIKPLNIF
jgi:exodeoxyribonuclease VIII